MSAFPQFTEFLEQPRVPPPSAHPHMTAWLSDKLAEQPMSSAQAAAFKSIQRQTLREQISPGSSLPEWQKVFLVECRAIVGPSDEQIRLLEHPKPPERAHEFQYFPWGGPNRGLRRDLALNELEQAYVFEDRSEVAAFIERNRFRGLLLEAREPLSAAFGVGAVKKLTLAEDDEGFTTLFCLVLIAGDMRAARLALRSFDEQWWLARSGHAGGKLNFDFELI